MIGEEVDVLRGPGLRSGLPEGRKSGLPRLPDRAWDVQLVPHMHQGGPVEPAAQLFGGHRLAENRLVHPAEQRRIVQVHPAIRLPEEPVWQLDHA